MAKTAAIEQRDDDRLQSMKAWPDRMGEFFRDVRTEMRKVSTPTRPQVQSTTVVVIITVFAFAFYFWVVDNALRYTLDQVIRHFSH